MNRCLICKKEKAKFKLWQTSRNKYEKFCGKDCLKIYTFKKYKKPQANKAFGLAQEFIEEIL
jgi:hypothetical protein